MSLEIRCFQAIKTDEKEYKFWPATTLTRVSKGVSMLNSDNSSIKPTQSTSSNYASSSSVRPSAPPTSGKDFKKVLGQSERKDNTKKAIKNDDTDADDEELETGEVSIASSTPVPSLFDLSKGNKEGQSGMDKDSQEKGSQGQPQPQAVIESKDSPSDLFKKLSSKEKGSSSSALKEKTPSQFPQEQTDLSYINPNLHQQSNLAAASIGAGKVEKPAALAPRLQEIVNQLIDKLYVMKADGQTETIITLKGPIFDQANLTVTSYDSARGQFNIKFDNLTPNAQQLITSQQNSLMETLKERGYTAHIIIATTTIETPITTGESTRPQRESQQQQGRGRDAEQENEEES
jgi:hypothetical protein